ncbi:RusA family crossover junction endodeoxyribonuclease [Chryseobacterium indologenes]|uniref:RusA family crossover junction endodeoxyribonuclease n=1 Tax=Chryseobacterium indologenes TaxID=253 RepID=UPI0023E7B3D1|nr:RusA family crossover junction endodeoxyribonuclease [Chryseobacterium indologenes]WET51655.1 RusA family crossover junction endodeoxyribonuclease [Chryseobacterium indologenes]
MQDLKTKITNLFQNNLENIEEIRKELFSIYNLSNDKNYDYNTSSIEEQEDISKWLNLNEIIFLGEKKEIFTKKIIFKNESDKLSYLAQCNCKFCGDTYPVVNFLARIKPHSRQTKTEIKNQFNKNFLKSTALDNIKFIATDKLCIKLIFVLNNERDKDLDNMAKITLDSLKELMKIDDKNIDHLELLKIKTKYIESHIELRISNSKLNVEDDIVLKGANLRLLVDKLD